MYFGSTVCWSGFVGQKSFVQLLLIKLMAIKFSSRLSTKPATIINTCWNLIIWQCFCKLDCASYKVNERSKIKLNYIISITFWWMLKFNLNLQIGYSKKVPSTWDTSHRGWPQPNLPLPHYPSFHKYHLDFEGLHYLNRHLARQAIHHHQMMCVTLNCISISA